MYRPKLVIMFFVKHLKMWASNALWDEKPSLVLVSIGPQIQFYFHIYSTEWRRMEFPWKCHYSDIVREKYWQ